MPDADPPLRLSLAHLHTFSREVFQACGVSESDADTAASMLVAADRRGIDSHSVARLADYVRMLQSEGVNPTPTIEVVRQSKSTATLDGDNGLGLVVGPAAMELTIEKADAAGSGWVAVRNSNHFGIAGYYSIQAVQKQMVGLALTNTTPQVSPLRSRERMLGTNPIAAAFPAATHPPVVIDMATSALSLGAVQEAARSHRMLPNRCALSAEGGPTRHPSEMRNGASLQPLGGDRPRGGHKGYCLSALVDLLCGVLSGANWGPHVPPFLASGEGRQSRPGRGTGHLFGTFRVGAFRPLDTFQSQVDAWVESMRSSEPRPGTNGPLIPGDPERDAAAHRSEAGVALRPEVLGDLRRLEATLDVSLPDPAS